MFIEIKYINPAKLAKISLLSKEPLNKSHLNIVCTSCLHIFRQQAQKYESAFKTILFPIRQKAGSGLHLSEQTASYNFLLLRPVASEQFPIK